MATDDIELTDEERVEAEAQAKAQREQDIAERLRSIEESVGDSTNAAKLMADPDVRALLAAKQAGKKVKVVEDQGEEDPDPQDVDYEGMDNKKLVQHLTKIMVKSVSQAAEQRVQGLEQQLSKVLEYIQTNETTGVQKQISDMEDKFADFNDLKPTMAKIARATPGLDVKQLYVLAKVEKGGLEGLRGGLGSERPTGSTARPPIRTTRKVPLPSGKRGFDSLLVEALDHNTKLSGRSSDDKDFEDEE